jgi:hypothetical protein
VSKDTARILPWNGQPTNRCDHISCRNPIAVHFELSAPGSEWAAEVDLCAEHLPGVADSARAFAVSLGTVAAETDLDRNIRAATAEHGIDGAS